MSCSLYSLFVGDPLALLFPAWVPNRAETGHSDDRTCVNQEIRGNDVSQVPAMVRSLAEKACDLGVCDQQSALHVQIALEEALTNAIVHGNLEVPSSLKDDDEGAFQRLVEERRHSAPYAERVVHLNAEFRPTGVKVVVADDGPGFDTSALRDPSLPENIELGHGRGIAMMRSFMDRVLFSIRGNAVMMYKRRALEDGEISSESAWATMAP
jgi:anti-sigma regulatory factor (Ser/Thr protein kinase)